jgi:hypothetical protein
MGTRGDRRTLLLGYIRRPHTELAWSWHIGEDAQRRLGAGTVQRRHDATLPWPRGDVALPRAATSYSHRSDLAATR